MKEASAYSLFPTALGCVLKLPNSMGTRTSTEFIGLRLKARTGHRVCATERITSSSTSGPWAPSQFEPTATLKPVVPREASRRVAVEAEAGRRPGQRAGERFEVRTAARGLTGFMQSHYNPPPWMATGFYMILHLPSVKATSVRIAGGTRAMNTWRQPTNQCQV